MESFTCFILRETGIDTGKNDDLRKETVNPWAKPFWTKKPDRWFFLARIGIDSSELDLRTYNSMDTFSSKIESLLHKPGTNIEARILKSSEWIVQGRCHGLFHGSGIFRHAAFDEIQRFRVLLTRKSVLDLAAKKWSNARSFRLANWLNMVILSGPINIQLDAGPQVSTDPQSSWLRKLTRHVLSIAAQWTRYGQSKNWVKLYTVMILLWYFNDI